MYLDLIGDEDGGAGCEEDFDVSSEGLWGDDCPGEDLFGRGWRSKEAGLRVVDRACYELRSMEESD